MMRRVYSREFKREAAQLMTMRGVSVARAARDLNVHATVLRSWVQEFGPRGPDAFHGKGQSCTSFQIGPLKWGCSP